MNNLFNPDNPAMRFLSCLGDLIILNLLFIFTSIPILTIGASTTAMYHVTLQMIKGESPSICKEYFKSFRSNLKQATSIWIPMILVIAFLSADLYVVYTVIDKAYLPLQIPIWLLFIIVLSVFIYGFAILSTYNTTTRQLLKNSILLSISNFPTTIFIIVLHLVPVFFAAYSWKNTVIVFSLLLFCGFSCIAYFISIFLNRIF